MSEAAWILTRRISAARAAGDQQALRRLAAAAMRMDPREATDVMRKAVETEIAMRESEGRRKFIENGRRLGLVPPIERSGS